MSNTFSKEITATFFGGNESGYEAVEQAWKEAVKTRKPLSAAHNLLYAALRGKDWTKGFSPSQDEYGFGAAQSALDVIHKVNSPWLLGPFTGVITQEGLENLRKVLPTEFPREEAQARFNKVENKRLTKSIERLNARIAELEADGSVYAREAQIASLKRFLATAEEKVSSLV